MENMTNSEIVLFLRMVLQIIEDSKDKEEAVEKIKALLNR